MMYDPHPGKIQVLPVRSAIERRIFLTFPWRIYRHDPLWVPPLLRERARTIDPQRGRFHQDGYAELFIAWRQGRPLGTICCAEDQNATRAHGYGECLVGFFECLNDYSVAQALFDRAMVWAGAHGLSSVLGTYNLDREDGRGILVEGRDRPPVSFCGHNPPYYPDFFERYGFSAAGSDNVAYAVDLDLDTPAMQRLRSVAEKVRRQKKITVRGGNINEIDAEIDRIVTLQNRGLQHFADFTPYTRAAIEAMILPVLEVIDPELVLFAEVNGEAVGWFPGVPNMNEVLIHLNGLRFPWDALRLLRYARLKPQCLAVKSVAVVPEYHNTGVAVLLFDEMVRRAASRGYRWLDLSLTGEDNLDTSPMALHLGARIYKRYRFYRKAVRLVE